MNLRKSIAILLAVMFAVASFAMAASADSTATVGGAEYKVTSPKSVAITGEGVTPSYRGNGSIEVLMDGDAAHGVSNHDQKGVVLIINDEVGAKATTPVKQDVENIPVASVEMDFGSNVSFDTAYMAIFWQQAGIYEPGDNKVIVETSADGKVWVPVGEDGTFYFSIPKCPSWKEGLPNSDQGWPYVGEVAIPLGETVKARYVRYSYTFAVLPEGHHWTYYTNVSEFLGLTEVGVANFKSGRKPAKLSAKDVATRPVIEGSWITEDGEEVTVVTFSDERGELEYTAKVYDKAGYLESGEEAEALDTVQGKYFIEGSKVAVIVGGKYDNYTASTDEKGNLIMDLDGEEYVYYTAENYASLNGGDTPDDPNSDDPNSDDPASDDPTSDDTSSEDAPTSVATSSGTTSDKTTSGSTSSKPSASSSAGSSATSSETSDEGGSMTLIIVIIVIAVVVIAAVVASLVVSKKKKQK